ncbi:MAG: hypothetical protein JRG73_12690 [Deltaproteobacteria bacterium]|nr:hypothetical protein [Deltaproteobacteria bacterium]
MNVGWIVPCADMYEALVPYHSHIRKCNWNIHIFHDHRLLKNSKSIYQPFLADFPRLRRHYSILHYFLDECAACRQQTILHLIGQKIFVSFSVRKMPFHRLLMAYLEG